MYFNWRQRGVSTIITDSNDESSIQGNGRLINLERTLACPEHVSSSDVERIGGRVKPNGKP